MGRSGRLFSLLRPYTFLFVANSVATLVASVMDGATFVLLIPFLRTLFGQQAIPVGGGSSVERVLAAVAGPLLAAGSPEGALRNVVAVLLGTLVLKNALSYAAGVWSIAIQEGVVRDLRVQLFEHLQVLPLGFFQRTRGGQLLARVISDTDQVKTTVTAALASLLQNVSLIVVYVAILVGLSWRLTLIALVCAPLLVLIIRPLVGKVRRRSREQVEDRGELTSLVSELVGSIKLVRAYVAEGFEAQRFRRLADRYRRRVLRAQRYATLTSPLSEVFAGVVIVLIFFVGTRWALGQAATLRPEVLIAFIAVALRLMSPAKSVANYPTAMAGALAAADRVYEVLDLEAEEGDRPGERPAGFAERIEYRGVSFSYDGQAPVLRDVDFAVRRGPVAAAPCEVHVPAHRRLAVVRERHAAVLDALGEAGGPLAGAVALFRLQVQHLVHAVRGGERAGHGRGIVGHGLGRGHEPQRDGDERDQHLGAERRRLAEGPARADEEDQHDHDAREHLGERARERRVALRAQHPAPIPIGEPAKALRLESLGDVGAHELDGAHQLAHEARELAPVFHLLARAPPHLPDQRPDDEHQERRAHQRDERQPPRQADEDRDVHDDEADVLEQRRQGGRHRRFHLVGVADDAGEELAAAGALEEAEREHLEVLEQLDARVADDALLDRDAPDARGVREGVLEYQRAQQHRHDVAERPLGRSRREQRPRDGGEHPLDARAAAHGNGLLPEQRAQEGDEQHERGPVHKRRDES